MFTKFELDTITIMVLNTNPLKWFSKESLGAEVKKHYQNSPDEFYYGHFLFVWSKLLINKNFIQVKEDDEKIKIKTQEVGPFEEFVSKDSHTKNHDYNLEKQLKHMTDFPKLYIGSVLIKDFLLKYYNCDTFFKFVDLYKDYFMTKSSDNQIQNYASTSYLNFGNGCVLSVTAMSLIMGYYYFSKK